jgi:ribosomal protein S16
MAEMIRALIEDAKLQSTVLRAYRSPPPQRAVGTLQFYVQITSAQHKSLEVFADRLADVAKRGVSLTETILALARWRLKQLMEIS